MLFGLPYSVLGGGGGGGDPHPTPFLPSPRELAVSLDNWIEKEKLKMHTVQVYSFGPSAF